MESITTYREEFNNIGTLYPAPDEVKRKQEAINDVNCYWFYPPEFSEDQLVIYLHGGAFTMGSIKSHNALVSNLAEQFSLPILFVEYGLAPEVPYPRGIEDAKKVFETIRTQYPNKKITLIGDSAGGGIAISLLEALEESNFAGPDQLVLISPWIDITCSNDSITENADIDPVLNRDQLLIFAELYSSSTNTASANPLNSIAHASFPPTLVMVGSQEILLDDSKKLYQELKSRSVDVSLNIYENQTHVWLLTDISSETSLKSIADIKTFLS